MPVPETTSAEAFERYVGGKCLRVGSGEAWRDIRAWTVALPRTVDVLHLPSVSEPFLAWTTSGISARSTRCARLTKLSQPRTQPVPRIDH